MQKPTKKLPDDVKVSFLDPTQLKAVKNRVASRRDYYERYLYKLMGFVP